VAGDCNADALFLELLRERDEVDRVAAGLLSGRPAFGPVSHRLPRLVTPELGFLRCITYLYALYFEAGRVAVAYLARVCEVYGHDKDGSVRRHIQLVDRMRTYSQHNLDVTKGADLQTVTLCEDWLQSVCGSRVPNSDDHWRSCLCALLEDALASARTFNAVVRSIEADESRDLAVAQWQFELDRFHGPEEFDRIISEAAFDMGYPHLDAPRFRKRYYERWVDRLRSLEGGYTFAVEARRLVEHALLTDAGLGMPLTGTDILGAFAISPGPVVRHGLELARKRFEREPTDKEGLIAYLRSVGFPNSQNQDRPKSG
jgi:hypothetical protein